MEQKLTMQKLREENHLFGNGDIQEIDPPLPNPE